VVLCPLGGSRAGKALVFSRPSRTDIWCGCLSVWSCSGWASFSTCVLSLYMYLEVYYYVASRCLGLYRVLLRQRTCMSASSLPFLLYETLVVGEVRDWVPDFAAYGTRSMAQHRMSTWPFPYHGVNSVYFYHFYVPFAHPCVIAKIIVLFLYCFGC
jgi:hypothetical protein